METNQPCNNHARAWNIMITLSLKEGWVGERDGPEFPAPKMSMGFHGAEPSRVPPPNRTNNFLKEKEK